MNLIVGSDSLIGSALMASLQKDGLPVTGTTRRRDNVDRQHLYLDLCRDVDQWRYPREVKTAVICAGVTKMDACRRDPAGSARINVDGVVRLAQNLADRGVFVIYLSSNQVFDGSLPYRLPEDALSPVTEYGRQKAEVENQLGKLGKSVSIVRFAKILGTRNPLFSDWIKALKENRPIHPFLNMFMAPVPLYFAVSVLSLVMKVQPYGILQVSGEKDVSYADAAFLAASVLDLDPGLIQPVDSVKEGGCREPAANHTTLNIDRLKSILKADPPDVRWTLTRAFVEPGVLGCG